MDSYEEKIRSKIESEIGYIEHYMGYYRQYQADAELDRDGAKSMYDVASSGGNIFVSKEEALRKAKDYSTSAAANSRYAEDAARQVKKHEEKLEWLYYELERHTKMESERASFETHNIESKSKGKHSLDGVFNGSLNWKYILITIGYGVVETFVFEIAHEFGCSAPVLFVLVLLTSAAYSYFMAGRSEERTIRNYIVFFVAGLIIALVVNFFLNIIVSVIVSLIIGIVAEVMRKG